MISVKFQAFESDAGNKIDILRPIELRIELRSAFPVCLQSICPEARLLRNIIAHIVSSTNLYTLHLIMSR